MGRINLKTMIKTLLLLLHMVTNQVCEELDPISPQKPVENQTQLHEFVLTKKKLTPQSSPGKGKSQLLALLNFIIDTYLTECELLVILHSTFPREIKKIDFDVTSLLQSLNFPVVHTQVSKRARIQQDLLQFSRKKCMGYLLFVKDVSLTHRILGNHSQNNVVVVAASSRWKIVEYLESPEARNVVNLLVIATNGPGDIVIRKGEKTRGSTFFNMYTHEIYTDGIGGSRVQFLTSWRRNSLARNITLFPQKLIKGFNGKQFKVTAATQVPYVLKKNLELETDASDLILWDGIEVRLIHLISKYLNYTVAISEVQRQGNNPGPTDAVMDAIERGLADIAIAGVFRFPDASQAVMFSTPHSHDCATFVTRSSYALPRYRAILGPFHWHVWVALVLTYFAAIFPINFADKHSFQTLKDHPWQIETLFWYVFGTFTNCFTFKGANSWLNTDKVASRMFIGWYWVFSIIISACYTGSIIAFITLFVFPPGLDSVDQLLNEKYRVVTLSYNNWSHLFNNSDHEPTKKLLNYIVEVHSVYDGLKNVTNTVYLPILQPYTLLAGREEMKFVITTNFSLKNTKDVLYISKECFTPLGISFTYPRNAPYSHKFDEFILRAQQGGLVTKIQNQIEWEFFRSSTDQKFQSKSGKYHRIGRIGQDRRLTLDDTQGMFLLLGAGYLIAIAAFFSERTRHHHTEGRSWKLWRYLQISAATEYMIQIYFDLRERIYEFNEHRSPNKADDFLFKTYDSRVLNSLYQRGYPPQNLNAVEATNKRKITKHHLSMPILTNSSQVTLKKTFSCQDLRMPSSVKVSNSTTYVRFGSVGSILQMKHCDNLLNYTFNYDRPQTSFN